LVEAAGGDLGRMRVDGDGGKALRRRDVAQMTAEALLVDREIVVERQQHGRDDAVGDELGVTGHCRLLSGRRMDSAAIPYGSGRSPARDRRLGLMSAGFRAYDAAIP